MPKTISTYVIFLTFTVVTVMHVAAKKANPDDDVTVIKLEEEPMGNTMTLDCDCRNEIHIIASSNYNITWTFNNQTLGQSGSRPIYDYKLKRGKRRLLLPGVHKSDHGVYRCVTRTKRRTLTCEYRVTIFGNRRVSSRPQLTVHSPQNGTHRPGEDVTLVCEIYSADELIWLWKSSPLAGNFTVLEPSDRVIVSTVEQNKSGVGDNEKMFSVTIRDVTEADSGLYRCQARNWLGLTLADFMMNVVEVETTVKSARTRYWWLAIICFLVLIIALNGVLWRRAKTNPRLYPIRNMDCIPQMEEVDEPGIPGFPHNTTMFSTFPPATATDMQVATATATLDNIVPLDLDWEIERTCIDIEELLDEGFFGQVYRARVKQLDGWTICAVKMLKDSRSDKDKADMVSEFEQMKRVGYHVNIACLLGVCTQRDTIWLIIEYAEEGNLREFLRRNRPNTIEPNRHRHLNYRDLVSASHQIANGMNFLVQKKCVHRDLAARNVLVTRDFTMKISDFGLARNIHAKDYYRKMTKGHLPYKWMALEALLENIFTHATDVWSFGVLLWEIFTLGQSPYPGVKTNDLVTYLRNGNRLGHPEFATPLLYRLMKDCWDEDATRRPSFRQLLEDFRLMMNSVSEDESGSSVALTRSTLTEHDESTTSASVDVALSSSDISCGVSPRTEAESLEDEFFGDGSSRETVLENAALLQQ